MMAEIIEVASLLKVTMSRYHISKEFLSFKVIPMAVVLRFGTWLAVDKI
jgi:hypothetical protein